MWAEVLALWGILCCALWLALDEIVIIGARKWQLNGLWVPSLYVFRLSRTSWRKSPQWRFVSSLSLSAIFSEWKTLWHIISPSVGYHLCLGSSTMNAGIMVPSLDQVPSFLSEGALFTLRVACSDIGFSFPFYVCSISYIDHVGDLSFLPSILIEERGVSFIPLFRCKSNLFYLMG